MQQSHYQESEEFPCGVTGSRVVTAVAWFQSMTWEFCMLWV